MNSSPPELQPLRWFFFLFECVTRRRRRIVNIKESSDKIPSRKWPQVAVSSVSTETSQCREETGGEGKILWSPQDPKSTQMWQFIQYVNSRYHKQLGCYADLHQWSITCLDESWEAIWDYCGVRAAKRYSKVIEPRDMSTMWPRPTWFHGARLNFAENLLFPTRGVRDDAIAVVAATEARRDSMTWAGLRERVRCCQASLIALGVNTNDRVAGCCANHIDTLVVMLATTSLGAIWTALSPDTGITAMVDRLSQIEPKILFTDDVATYNAKTHSVLPKVREATRQISALRAMVILSAKPESESASSPASALLEMTYSEFLAGGRESHELSFEQFPAEHPVYILYSSGTTGKPKCIVHGAIGTLLQHKKEHILQSDIKPGDRLFFFTTCMWMMWHWHVSALASGITLVLYDGSPFYYRREGYTEAVEDYQAMPKLIDELQITHFGTSAKYLSVLQQKAVRPKESGLCLKSLKAIYSTGSPLAPTTFEYVYDIFGSSIQLGSISGGTDIIADFGVPCPIEPVHSGEIQVPALGMAVQAWSQEGVDVSRSTHAGELVCVRPFPSQPVCFWGASGFDNYKAAYFQRFPGVWHHGDFIRFNEATGGIYMLGRSDGTLNPSGVRFGSAEIYNVLLSNFADCVADSLCVGQRRENETDETVVLFVKMLDERRLTSELVQTIKKTVWDQLSPRHVPRHVVECPEIPYTHNNKKVELAVKRIISGTKVTSTAGIANGHCLAWYQDWASTKLDEEHI